MKLVILLWLLVAGCANTLISSTKPQEHEQEQPSPQVPDIDYCEPGSWGWYAVVNVQDGIFVYLLKHKVRKDEVKVFVDDIVCRIHEEALVYIMPQAELADGGEK